MTGRLFLPTNSYVSGNVALNFDQIKGEFVDMNNLYVTRRFNMVNHKIINLGDPADDKDATNKNVRRIMWMHHILFPFITTINSNT